MSIARLHGGPIDSVSRRNFLNRMALVAANGTAATLAVKAISAHAFAATQNEWRQCQKCNMMFYNGYRKSICPAGQRHSARVGENYVLPYNVPESPNAQGAWRFCNKCESLFFDGYPDKGKCPGGGGHVAQGFVFVLPHDVRDSGYQTKDWRYCNKCHSMFHDEYQNKGRCPTSGAHVAQGFNFVLRFRGNLEGDTAQHPADQ